MNQDFLMRHDLQDLDGEGGVRTVTSSLPIALTRSDMTQRNHTEEALDECEKKLFEALGECPLSVTLTSAIDHRYIEVNHTFERITGWNRDEVIGRTPFDIDLWVDPSQRVDFVRRLLAGGTVIES